MSKEFSYYTWESKSDLTLPDFLLEKLNKYIRGNKTGRQELKNPTVYIGNHYISSAVKLLWKDSAVSLSTCLKLLRLCLTTHVLSKGSEAEVHMPSKT